LESTNILARGGEIYGFKLLEASLSLIVALRRVRSAEEHQRSDISFDPQRQINISISGSCD
jgi:hypothetical protein